MMVRFVAWIYRDLVMQSCPAPYTLHAAAEQLSEQLNEGHYSLVDH